MIAPATATSPTTKITVGAAAAVAARTGSGARAPMRSATAAAGRLELARLRRDDVAPPSCAASVAGRRRGGYGDSLTRSQPARAIGVARAARLARAARGELLRFPSYAVEAANGGA